MPSQQTYKHYSAADMERYHSGGMTAAEMHALEKAALEDPFLADALDGYAHTKTPVTDIRLLKKEIRKQKGHVVVMPFKGRRLAISIAALFVLLVGFGWLAHQFSTNNVQDVALQTETGKSSLPVQDSKIRAADSTSQGKATAGNLKSKKQEPSKPLSPEKKSAANTAADSEMEANEDAVTDAAPPARTFSNTHIDDTAVSDQTTAAMARAFPKKEFKGRVTDTTGSPVPFAIVAEVNKQNSAATDAAGHFSIASNDTNMRVSVTATGYKAKQAKFAATDSLYTIVLPRSESSLQEVVVTGNGKRRQTKSRLQLENVTPRASRTAVDTELAADLAWPKDSDEEEVHGTVALNFDVDRAGKAINIEVAAPLCANCDSAAVRFVREKMRWRLHNNSKKAKATIRF